MAVHKIKLQTPLKVEGTEINEITIRVPKVRDLIASSRAKGDLMEQGLALVANLSEVSIEALEEMDARDYLNIQNWLKDFLSLETSEN